MFLPDHLKIKACAKELGLLFHKPHALFIHPSIHSIYHTECVIHIFFFLNFWPSNLISWRRLMEKKLIKSYVESKNECADSITLYNPSIDKNEIWHGWWVNLHYLSLGMLGHAYIIRIDIQLIIDVWWTQTSQAPIPNLPPSLSFHRSIPHPNS